MGDIVGYTLNPRQRESLVLIISSWLKDLLLAQKDFSIKQLEEALKREEKHADFYKAITHACPIQFDYE